MKHNKWLAIIGVALVFVLVIGLTVTWIAPTQWATPIIGQGQKSFTIGHIAYAAAGELDYICDGTDDNVQFQAALDALPVGGGKLVALSGNYSFSSTVTRAISNVTIEGNGASTNFTYDASTPIFTAGGNNWVFRDFRTDAGGVNLGVTTGWTKENLAEGFDYMALQVSGNITPSANNTHSLGTPDLRWGDIWTDNSTIHIGTVELTDEDGCLATDEVHLHGDEDTGEAGYVKLQFGTAPTHLEANHFQLWAGNITDTEKLYWQTDNGTNLEIVRFDSSGRLGIGEISPDERLHITGNNAAVKLEDDSGNYAILKVGNSQLTIDADPDDAVASTDIVFKLDGSEVARFYVGGGGSFGIGTITPDAKLEVVGDVKFSAWETQSLTEDGYAQIGSVLYQWGTEAITDDDPQQITLPAAFANTTYQVTIGIHAGGWTSGGAISAAMTIGTKSTSNFYVDRDNNVTGTVTIDWVAIGY